MIVSQSVVRQLAFFYVWCFLLVFMFSLLAWHRWYMFWEGGEQSLDFKIEMWKGPEVVWSYMVVESWDAAGCAPRRISGTGTCAEDVRADRRTGTARSHQVGWMTRCHQPPSPAYYQGKDGGSPLWLHLKEVAHLREQTVENLLLF